MGGSLVLESVLILLVVQSAHSGGYSAGVSGVPNGQEPHFNGRKPHHNGGAGRILKGVGVQNGYGGYPNKGVGYGRTAGLTPGALMKGYGAGTRGPGGWPQGYGNQAVPINQHPVKANGYRGNAGAFGGQGNKGYGGAAHGPEHGNKGPIKGYGPATGALGGNGIKPIGYGRNGHANKGYGYGAKAGVPNRAGNNGLGGAGQKPMKPYGSYGSGPGMSAFRGQAAPQLARNQGKGYGHNGYAPQPMAGFLGGYGGAGMGLGPRYGNGGMKGPKPAYNGAAAGVPRRQGLAPSGYGGTNYPVKAGFGNIPNGIGVKPNGYGAHRGGFGPAALPHGYGAKPNGYGPGAAGNKGYGANPNGPGNGAPLGSGNKLNGYGAGGMGPASLPQNTKGFGPASPGQGTGGFTGIANPAANPGFGHSPYAKGPKRPGPPNGIGLKGNLVSPQQPGSPMQKVPQPQRPIVEGDAVPAPEPTSGRLVLVTQDQHQKLPLLVPQMKNYMPLQETPGHVPVFPQGKPPKRGPESSPGPGPLRPMDKSFKPLPYDSGPARKPMGEIPPQENGGGPSIPKGQGGKAGKPDCLPGGPNGQWMKVPRPDYNPGAGPSGGTNTKGYGTGAGFPNRFPAKPGYGVGSYAGPLNGYGTGTGYPNSGQPQQPIYRQGAYLGGTGYVKGNANTDPGQGLPTPDAKSAPLNGGIKVPYNAVPALPTGIDGAGQPDPQPVGLVPNGKQGPVYGGMEGLPYSGPAVPGPENAKYGIGGLQFGGNPQTGNDKGNDGGANTGGLPAQYGYDGGYPNVGHHLGLGSNGHMAGKYGYGRLPHEAQPVGFVPQMESPGEGPYGPVALPYQQGSLDYGPNGNYGADGSYGPQGLDDAGKHGLHQQRQLQSSDTRPGSPYDSRPDVAPINNDNVGYISGSKLQPEVISLPSVPTPAPMDPAYTPQGADQLQSDAPFDSDASHTPERTQRLKLNFNTQGSKNAKYDLNGFFGNSGYQG